eukprot:1160655-Pelagomonas_calceolata.AAC.2
MGSPHAARSPEECIGVHGYQNFGGQPWVAQMQRVCQRRAQTAYALRSGPTFKSRASWPPTCNINGICSRSNLWDTGRCVPPKITWLSSQQSGYTADSAFKGSRVETLRPATRPGQKMLNSQNLDW